MCKFGMENVFGPGSRVASAEDSEICFNFLVYSFGLPIRLWVISGGEGEVVFEEFS